MCLFEDDSIRLVTEFPQPCANISDASPPRFPQGVKVDCAAGRFSTTAADSQELLGAGPSVSTLPALNVLPFLVPGYVASTTSKIATIVSLYRFSSIRPLGAVQQKSEILRPFRYN